MALIERKKKPQQFNWNVRETTNIRNKLPAITNAPTIDYDKLNWLCNINGLKSRDSNQSTQEAHEVFMQNYKKIFVPQPAKVGLPVHTEKRVRAITSSTASLSNQATSSNQAAQRPKKETSVDLYTYNIKDYLPLLHKERKSEDPKAIRGENIRTLRRLLRKYPFERTAADNDKVYSILLTFPFFKDNVDPAVLKELCVVAQLETWKDTDFSVYGKTGIYMVLRGEVKPVFSPYLLGGQNGVYPESFLSLEGSDLKEEDETYLRVGDCFGTWLHYEEPYTKEFSVVTTEPNAEFMKISANDYKRVITQIKQREHTEKLNLLLSCEQYRMWPKQPLISVADSIDWISYPPNTVLVSEGYKSPFIGFIRLGECHVLRQVDVLVTLKNGKKEQRTKQVVMGRLGPSDSFAEISLLLDEPVTCSIVTASDVELGVVRPEKLKNLDDVTQQLFRQSNTRTFGDLTKEDIQNEYLQQELKREWNEFKHAEVLEVINAYGVRPGYGKWAK
ncbi:cyclic nucleotide-binding domain-containing protein 1 [Plakobranchus ocellatus]|uniref:Cyclic nucleotide-binding domain-containing protein 1 n=1 Tax=Plakobranchus ocellatus TaxID=259542 RepID=A0AAV4C253_9GAST|nr:cyclic nucleotide-binding domain-containing protein 1 [Plakobranchus ocellatus]